MLLRCFVLRSLLCGLLGLTQIAFAEGEGLRLYVSTKGNDAWSGRLREPNAALNDGPIATLAGARDAIRRLREKGNAGGTITVLIRKGAYYLSSPLEFGPQDSGVAYAAFPGEKPVISGGREITNWIRSRLGRKIGHEVWSAEIPEVKEGKWWFRELFVDGERRPRTRLPKEGLFHFTSLVEATGEHLWSDGVMGAGFSEGDLLAWKNLQDVEIVALTRWIESRSPIAALDLDKHIVTFAKKSTFRLEDTKHPEQFAPYYVENVFEALKDPGQWYLDKGEGVLYYLPKPGEGPRSLRAIAPAIPQILVIQGKDDQKVHDIRFENLTFRHAGWQYPGNKAGSSQAAVDVPGAVFLEAAERCAFTGCTIEQVGTYGFEAGKECKDITVSHCLIQDLGAGGVKIGHGADSVTVADCEITHSGRIYPSGVGVWIGNSGHNQVVHNHIHDIFYTGISVGWTWGYGDSKAVENKIEYNHIHDIGQGLLSDMGGIYMLGISPGTVLSHNLIHDVSSYHYGGWGIYTDEGSTHILIENNVVYRTKTGGFHQHYGKENTIRNNIFALAVEQQLQRSREEDHKSFDFTNNIVYFTQGNLLGSTWKNDHFFFDKNLYWNPDPGKIDFMGESLDTWKARGHDRNSLIADPLFTAPEKDDFKLKPESPAFGLGFQQIDLTEVGPRKRL